MINKMIRAAMLDVSLYEEVEADSSLTTEAILVVVIVSLISGIGGLLGGVLRGGHPISGLLASLLMTLVGYFVWVFVLYYVGTSLFHGTADYGEVLRTTGYAYTPAILGFFVFIPYLGWLAALIGSVWALIAGVIAVRQALDFDTTKAIWTVLIGWVVMLVVSILIGSAFGGMRMMF